MGKQQECPDCCIACHVRQTCPAQLQQRTPNKHWGRTNGDGVLDVGEERHVALDLARGHDVRLEAHHNVRHAQRKGQVLLVVCVEGWGREGQGQKGQV